METGNILGISYSTRLIGLAVFSSFHLVDCSVKLYKERWSPEKCDKIRQTLQTCLEDYNIQEIVLSIPPHYYQTEGFHEINDTIISFANDMGILVSYQNYKMLYTLITTKGKETKRALMQSLSDAYPQLERFYEKERRNKKRYYVKLFEAVGVALLQTELNFKKEIKNKG